MQFEAVVATEGLARALYNPRLKAQPAALPPKLFEIGDGVPRVVEVEAETGGVGAWIKRKAVFERLGTAAFTGKGDREVAVELSVRRVHHRD